MKQRRRAWLTGAVASATLALLHARPWPGGSAQSAAARDQEASWRHRHANPLRRPGDDGWAVPVPARQVSCLTATDTALVLRGRRPTPLWAYRAEVAGRHVNNPLLLGHPGDLVALRFENRIPQSSVIHWHGFTNDSANDGNPMAAAAPGGTLDCHWRIRNGAGLNWYHPHPHGLAGEQAWRGLAGLFIVEDEASDRLARLLDLRFGSTDLPLVLQDRTVQRSGAMPYGSAMEAGEKAARGGEAQRGDDAVQLPGEALCVGGSGGAPLHGVQGDDILVNLTRFPFVRLPRRWVRFRILNASNARVYRLAFEQRGAVLPLALLGTDNTLLPAPLEMQSVFLAPAQRVDVALDLRRAQVGDAWLKTLDFDPMHQDERSLLRAAIASAAAATHRHGPQGEGAQAPILRIEVEPAGGDGGRLPHEIGDARPTAPFADQERSFRLGQDRDGRWAINGRAFTGRADAFQAAAGARETWTLHNETASMPHPMHLHGFAFTVLGRAGSPAQLTAGGVDAQGRSAQDQGRQDTVLVWPGETVRLGVDLALPFAGPQRYMFHCHNLEHEDQGMMLTFSVGR
jgi:suppressor of ftsI/bilirubin oxidase